MFVACVEVCFNKLCYSSCISLYDTQCCVTYWLCEPLFCRKKAIHLLTPDIFYEWHWIATRKKVLYKKRNASLMKKLDSTSVGRCCSRSASQSLTSPSSLEVVRSVLCNLSAIPFSTLTSLFATWHFHPLVSSNGKSSIGFTEVDNSALALSLFATWHF